MKVALFADPLYMRLQSGIPRYTQELARHLLTQNDVTLELFSLFAPERIAAAQPPGGLPPAQSCRHAFVPRQAQYLLWHRLKWAGPAGAVMRKADVVHTPFQLVPPRKTKPLVVTIHDLSNSLFPQHHTRYNRLIMDSGLKRAVADADAFITDAECTAMDLSKLTGVPQSRIFPIPLGADARFKPTIDSTVPARYGIHAPYVLYVGTLEPRKNVTLLLNAFGALDYGLIDKALGGEVKLVIAGKKGWMYQEIFDLTQRLNLHERVIFTDFVPDEDLPALYSSATVFVYPSLFEGFGLPVLEAMACGVPVITTNVSSLPEVAGNAALMVAPNDVEGLTRMLEQTLLQSGLREELRGKSIERAKLFSWEKTAQMTVDVYRAVLAKS